jgi:hypothetical protein
MRVKSRKDQRICPRHTVKLVSDRNLEAAKQRLSLAQQSGIRGRHARRKRRNKSQEASALPCDFSPSRAVFNGGGTMRLALFILFISCCTFAQTDDPDAHPPVTQQDIAIVHRAKQILHSPKEWNRADNRKCPKEAKTFSIYCALEKATVEVTGNFEHRGAAMQETRFVVEELSAGRDYHHRLMDYNNDPKTSFADVQKVFRLVEKRIRERLKANKGR